MPIIPNPFEQFLFLTLNQGPAPLFDLFSAAAFRAVLAALDLGVFEALDDGPASAAQLAQRIGADERGTGVLLSTLAALGYVRANGAAYANTRMTAKWLVRRSPDNVVAGFALWKMLLTQHWHNLEDSIRTGRPPLDFYAWVEQHPEASRDFQNWMIATTHFGAPEILSRVRLPAGARRLLDVGGGHGMYSLAYCRKYPQLSAVVFDAPQALEAARANIAAEPLGGRVATQVGDFINGQLGSGYDVVLLFNIVHGFTPEQNAALLRKAAAALNPGGLVLLVEQIAGKSPGAAATALAELLGLGYYHLLGGHIYSYEEIAGWLTGAGLAGVRRVNLIKVPGNCVIVGRNLASVTAPPPRSH